MIGLLLLALAVCGLAIVVPEVRKRLRQQRALSTIPGPPCPSFWTGVSTQLHNPYAVEYREQVLTEYGRVVKLPAFVGDIHLAISDSLALSTLYNKYRDAFDLPKWHSETSNTVFGPGLTAARGQQHSKQRKHLSPVFSVRYLRDMVTMFNQVAQDLVDTLHGQVSQEGTEVEMSEYLSRFSLEAVGRTALGYSFGPLDVHGTDYSLALKEFGPTLVKLHLWRPILPWLKWLFPLDVLRAAASVFPWKVVRHMQAISDNVYQTSREVLRKKGEAIKLGDAAVRQEIGEGKDLISILLRQNILGLEGERLSEDDILGQMSLLLLAATDTTSASITRVVQLLAENPKVQETLRREILDATTHVGRTLFDLDYDAFAKLPYLEAVVRESLRMYPVFYMANRVSDEDALLPLSEPITGTDGKQIQELFIPAGTTIWLNMLGSNRDPAIWGPDAHEWKPERWLAPLPASVADARTPSVFANMSTFAAGPRSCIGYNYALAEMRIAVAHLVLAFKFTPSDKEIVWKLGGIVSPSVRGSDSMKPEFPVVMARA
uniref:Cytochrome P450 monooxygenase n=1 Tax=Trametes versicolor TaxID=5325 RepID=A0AA86IW52_TRAVE|nr:cytochrome P450 monooxygenase [Trametes versicolor]